MTDPAALAACRIARSFVEYNAQFRAITRRAPVRFDARDWRGGQRHSLERIELYDGFVARRKRNGILRRRAPESHRQADRRCPRARSRGAPYRR
ncbi:MAG: isocitrate dehydrogenase kinase/phosphatase AceK regulatory subunit [Steroidobacteraceae bacterium]